jgi:hypothetical protein
VSSLAIYGALNTLFDLEPRSAGAALAHVSSVKGPEDAASGSIDRLAHVGALEFGIAWGALFAFITNLGHTAQTSNINLGSSEKSG